MIFGMGGGKALDTAKGAAERAGLPVFTFPTIAATCAATTALSVVYREDGNFDSFYFYDKPARHCFINTRDHRGCALGVSAGRHGRHDG